MYRSTSRVRRVGSLSRSARTPVAASRQLGRPQGARARAGRGAGVPPRRHGRRSALRAAARAAAPPSHTPGGRRGGRRAAQGCARARQAAAATHGLALVAPPPALCTDNGAMVAWAGVERLRLGLCEPPPPTPPPEHPLVAASPGLDPGLDAGPTCTSGRARHGGAWLEAGAAVSEQGARAGERGDWVEVRPRWPLTDRCAALPGPCPGLCCQAVQHAARALRSFLAPVRPHRALFRDRPECVRTVSHIRLAYLVGQSTSCGGALGGQRLGQGNYRAQQAIGHSSSAACGPSSRAARAQARPAQPAGEAQRAQGPPAHQPGRHDRGGAAGGGGRGGARGGGCLGPRGRKASLDDWVLAVVPALLPVLMAGACGPALLPPLSRDGPWALHLLPCCIGVEGEAGTVRNWHSACLRPQTTLCHALETEVAVCDAWHVCGCSLNKLMWVLRRMLRRMCNCTF